MLPELQFFRSGMSPVDAYKTSHSHVHACCLAYLPLMVTTEFRTNGDPTVYKNHHSKEDSEYLELHSEVSEPYQLIMELIAQSVRKEKQ